MCTLEKRGNFFILSLTGDAEHRLNPTLIADILSALAQAKTQATRGSVLITVAQGKFFCNGFDLKWAQAGGSKEAAERRLIHMVESFRPVVSTFISLPMPTIAAITGHAAAAGFMLALSHDYVLMRRDKGVLYMSEVDIGLTIPDYFVALVREKIGSALARRDVLLGGRKITGAEAESMKIVEAAYDSEEGVREASTRLAEKLGKRNWDGEVYAEIRKGVYPELCVMFGLSPKVLSSPKL